MKQPQFVTCARCGWVSPAGVAPITALLAHWQGVHGLPVAVDVVTRPSGDSRKESVTWRIRRPAA
jgi:hypothetical protein